MTTRARAATAAALVLFAVAAWALVARSAAPARASGTICVGLVVDLRAFGGDVATTCATVPEGSSGSDVLTSAHRVTWDPRYGEDFVCAIDGEPAGGCHSVDGTHYWVYYHRAPGGSTWSVSQEGAGTYRPRNGATEGWVYDDGGASAPRPPDVPYAEICPRSSTSPTASPPRTATAKPSSTPASSRTVAATPAADLSPRPPASARARLATRSATGGRSAGRRGGSPVAPLSASATASPAASPAAAQHRADVGTGGGPPAGLLAGIAAGAALGGGAWWRSRRSPR